jgi:microcin C transport system substrate-binding protein
MMAVGPLPPDEHALLEPFRDKLSPLVFGEAVLPPVSDGSGADRRLLQASRELLAQAGWTITGGALRNAAGERFAIEFLDDNNSLEKHTAPLIQNLRRLGIDANYRVVDTAQYQKRSDDFDFDMLVRNTSFGSTPGEDLRNSFSAKAAAAKGSYNLSGIADPVVDALIDRILAADERKDLEIACRALDRVLRAGFYWIPQWHKAVHWLAYWDRFEHLAEQPPYARGAPEVWWGKG